MENLKEMLDLVRGVIQESKYLVCLKGVKVSTECGCTNYRVAKDAYAIEKQYGLSAEEMFNASYYNTRVNEFYDFYKKYMISQLGELKEGLYVLKRLEEQGLLKCIITRDILSLAKRAGCRNVLELHGSVYKNFCPHCREEYSIEYVQNSKGVPRCTKCKTVIRPGVALMGEMLDNGLVSKASEEVSKADTLIVLGSNMKANLTSMMVQYFQGDKIILINEEEHHADRLADIVIHAKPMETLEKLGL